MLATDNQWRGAAIREALVSGDKSPILVNSGVFERYIDRTVNVGTEMCRYIDDDVRLVKEKL